MHKYTFYHLLLPSLLSLLLHSQALGTSLNDRWQALMDDGPNQQAKGNYNNAIRAFDLAASLAEKQKLPPKCLPLALCRLTQVEVLSNHYDSAEVHFQRLVKLVKAQKQDGNLDPEVGVWLVDLADTYQARQNPNVRESCLRNACMLKSLTFGGQHKECTDCLMLLAHLYLDRGQVDKAVQILSKVCAIQEKKFGKNPDALGNILHQQAIEYKKRQQYEQAKQLELSVIKLAKITSSPLNSGLPAFYSFLGINALASGKNFEGKQCFVQAMKDCKKADSSEKTAKLYFDTVTDSARSDIDGKHYSLAEAELTQLLAVQQMLSNNPDDQYGIYNLLSIALNSENKVTESEKCLLKTIALAQMPNSYNRNDLPELYLRLAIYERPDSVLTDTASKAFAQAFNAEPDKTGFHATLVLFWWGKHLREERSDVSGAFEKWNSALTAARALPPEKRGTLAADTLAIMANSLRRSGRENDAQKLEQEAHQEIQLQSKINTKLGPDHFKMLSSYAALHH